MAMKIYSRELMGYLDVNDRDLFVVKLRYSTADPKDYFEVTAWLPVTIANLNFP
jgi:hypothetical protein